MDSKLSVTQFAYVSKGDYLIRKYNNSLVEFWKFISVGYSEVYTFPFAWNEVPVTIVGFRTSVAGNLWSRELCAFNVTKTTCEFSNFTYPTDGGQGGWLYCMGEVA